MDMVKLGIIGLGNMGQNHLRIAAILKKADICRIHDLDANRTQDLARQYDAIPCSSVADVFREPLDAVILCTPTSTHAEYIRQAAAHVKNIFVEKPMTATLEEAKEICALVQSGNLNLQVGFIERFNPAIQQLKAVLDASSKVISVDFTRTNKLSARITDVDVISDLMVHDIDLALYLNGPVRDISAHGAVDHGLVSFASAILTHENGKFSRIQASRITEKKIRKIEATCEDMFVDCELLKKEIVVNRQSETSYTNPAGYRISAVQENIEVKPQEALLLELQAFIESCIGGTSSIAPHAIDGLKAVKICDAIQQEIYP